METSKRKYKVVGVYRLKLDQIGPILEMCITLKFTETILFLIKLDYLYTV